MTGINIASSAVLVEMNISVWTANKLDRGVTDDLTYNKGASRNAAKVHKDLMAGTSLRKRIADYSQACRNWHLQKTLSWADKGVRLLPTSLFLDYKQEANNRIAYFNEMVDKFVDAYPQLVRESANHLGSMFNPNDYPEVDAVRNKFDFRLVFSPVPTSGDFRVDIGNQALAELRQEYEQEFQTRVADAVREPWEKLHDMLVKMSEKLGLEEKTRWYDTFLGNAQDMCQMLKHLNITNDVKLEAARRDLEIALQGTDMDSIREDVATRADIKAKLDGILKEYEW